MYRMEDDIGSVLVTEDRLRMRIREMGLQLAWDYEGKDVVAVGILKGAVPFYAALTLAVPMPLKMDFMAVSSYGSGSQSSGTVRIMKDLSTDIKGKHVLIVEDIMDSGLTLSRLVELLKQREPASVKICCLLDKPSRRECDITPDYCGFEIPNEFVVGFGLDYDEKYRNIPYIGVLKPEVYQNA